MKPIITNALAALLVLVTPLAVEAQRRAPLPFPPQPRRAPPAQAPMQRPPSVGVRSLDARFIAEARRIPDIAPLSPQARAQRVHALLGNPHATLAATSTIISVHSAESAVQITVYDAGTVDLTHGSVGAWARPAGIGMTFPGSFAGRYVFDCPVWGTSSFSWSNEMKHGLAQVVDHHGLFVVDLEPKYSLDITLTPESSFVSWMGCEMTRVE